MAYVENNMPEIMADYVLVTEKTAKDMEAKREELSGKDEAFIRQELAAIQRQGLAGYGPGLTVAHTVNGKEYKPYEVPEVKEFFKDKIAIKRPDARADYLTIKEFAAYIPYSKEDLNKEHLAQVHRRDSHGLYPYFKDKNQDGVINEDEKGSIKYMTLSNGAKVVNENEYKPLMTYAIVDAKGNVVADVIFPQVDKPYALLSEATKDKVLVILGGGKGSYFMDEKDISLLFKADEQKTKKQLIKVDAEGRTTHRYMLGDTMETSEVERLNLGVRKDIRGTQLGKIYKLNSDGSIGDKPVAETVSGGTVAQVLRAKEHDGHVKALVAVRRDLTSGAVQSAVGVDEKEGYLVIEYYKAEKRINGTFVEGKAYFGDRSDPKRPIYYYNSQYQLLDREGNIVGKDNLNKVAGYAVRRSDLQLEGVDNEIGLGEYIIAEEQGYESMVKTQEQARAVLENHHRSSAGFRRESAAEGLEAGRINVLDEILQKEFIELKAAVLAKNFDKAKDAVDYISTIRKNPIEILTHIDDKTIDRSVVEAELEGVLNEYPELRKGDSESTKYLEAKRLLAGRVDYLSFMMNRLEDGKFVKAFIVNVYTDRVKGEISKNTELSYQEEGKEYEYYNVQFNLKEKEDFSKDDEDSITKTYIATKGPNSDAYEMKAVKYIGLNDGVKEGDHVRAMTFDEVMNDIYGNYYFIDSNKERVKDSLAAGVRDIAADIKGSIDLTKYRFMKARKINQLTGKIEVSYRIVEDPLARVVAFVSSGLDTVRPDVIINVSFEKTSSPVKAYEFSAKGWIYLTEAAEGRLTPQQLINEELGLKGNKLLGDEIPAISDKSGYGSQEELVKISRKIWIGDRNGNGKMDESEFEAFGIRYLGYNDPDAKDFVKVDGDSILFMKYSNDVKDKANNLPVSALYNISSSEAAYNKELGRIVKATEYSHRRGDEFIYGVPFEYREGQVLRNRDTFVANNFHTGDIREIYADEHRIQHSYGGMPLYTTKLGGTFSHKRDMVNYINNRTVSMATVGEHLHSVFDVTFFETREHGRIMAVREIIKSSGTRMEAVTRLFQDHKEIAVIKGNYNAEDLYRTVIRTVESDRVNVQVYKPSLIDQFFNSLPGRIVYKLTGIGHMKETIEGDDSKIDVKALWNAYDQAY
ncbi:MAG TPA: hypothetical protein VLJ10_05930, partial [Candidatus Bathyarchaeia archaeon]|nr:hypothetical protein [Candidatus Bathyarchaeia archaeon]